MSCFNPLSGWINSKTGKFSISSQGAFRDLPQQVPCGQCLGCKIERSRMWAMRIMHEAKMYDDNCFITLTYSPEAVQELKKIENWRDRSYSLYKDDVQNFYKRLRKELSPQKIRYYTCGEYGDLTMRPHYHAIIFGFWDKKMKYYKTANGNRLYTSPFLEKIWGHGFVVVAEVNYDTAQYVSQYVTKKISGSEKRFHYRGREPEFALMSRRPGIGASYYEKYLTEIHNHDTIIVNGVECKPPRYYDDKTKKFSESLFENIRRKRRQDRSSQAIIDQHLEAKEAIKRHQLKMFSKGII